MTKRRLAITGGLFSLIGLAGPGLADSDNFGGVHHDHMWNGGWGFVGAGVMLLFWIVTILAIFLAVRWVMTQNGQPNNRGGSGAMNNLRDRLARGEIEIEEFEARKSALET